jgi:hypothetical protein
MDEERISQEVLIERIYNAFDPKRPLEPDSPFYVDCHAVRGQENIINEVGKNIVLSNQPTYQLYTGHRGAGKSTELYRLRRYLEQHNHTVIYFEATDDLDETDVQYTDILLSCTRHLLDALNKKANTEPLVDWLRSRWQSLKDLALTDVEFDKLELQSQISQFAKLTATLRTVPSARQKIREQVDVYSVSLIQALNEFINDAKRKLDSKELVIIADNLDRIGLVVREDGKTNHDDIFIDHSSQMCRLKCNIVYTVPISLVYSNRASHLRNTYGNIHVLPMVMVRERDGTIHKPGLAIMKQLVRQRTEHFTKLPLFPEVFESEEILDRLCLISGGHLRELMQLVQTSLNWTEQLPVQKAAVLRAIAKGQDDYRNAVDERDWVRLAEVAQTKRIQNDDEYRALLFNRCVLEYRMVQEKDDDFQTIRWHDVNPLIEIPELFKQAADRQHESKIEESQ